VADNKISLLINILTPQHTILQHLVITVTVILREIDH
jgi:hypothetical protein